MQTTKLFLPELIVGAVNLGARDAEDVCDENLRVHPG
jgi:hypothetical protein